MWFIIMNDNECQVLVYNCFDDMGIDVKMYRTWPSFWPCRATPVNQRHFSTETKAAAECFVN